MVVHLSSAKISPFIELGLSVSSRTNLNSEVLRFIVIGFGDVKTKTSYGEAERQESSAF